MNKIFYVIVFAIIMAACTPKKDASAIKEETMKLHDQVMADHSKIIANQMKIDTLLQSLSTLKAAIPTLDTEKNAFRKLKADLVVAEESMNDWMHNFNAEYSNDEGWEVIHYYKQQRDQIATIGDLYRKEIKRANAYLTKFKK